MEKPVNLQAPAFILGIDVSKYSMDVCLIRVSDHQHILHMAAINSVRFNEEFRLYF